MAERKRIFICFEVVMEYEVSGDPHVDTEEGANRAWWIENEHCISNVIGRLAESVAAEDEKSICNICRFAKVAILEPGTEAYPIQEVSDDGQA